MVLIKMKYQVVLIATSGCVYRFNRKNVIKKGYDFKVGKFPFMGMVRL